MEWSTGSITFVGPFYTTSDVLSNGAHVITDVNMGASERFLAMSATSGVTSLSSYVSLLWTDNEPLEIMEDTAGSPCALPILPQVDSTVSRFFFYNVVLRPIIGLSSDSAGLGSRLSRDVVSSRGQSGYVVVERGTLDGSARGSLSSAPSVLLESVPLGPGHSTSRSLSMLCIMPTGTRRPVKRF